MRSWHFKDYRPEGGKSQVQAWYRDQGAEIQAQFDDFLDLLSQLEDIEIDCTPLTGDYLGLYEIIIDVEAPYGVVNVRPIGVWQPDSRNFIILTCCIKNGDKYNPPLELAVAYKATWESGKGGTDDRI